MRNILPFVSLESAPAAEDTEEKGKVFLGGTIESGWRDALIKDLKVPYFNPVTKDWDETARQREESEKENAACLLYVITPQQKNFYSIAELTKSAIESPGKTVIVFLEEYEGDKFLPPAWESMLAIQALVKETEAKTFLSLDDGAQYINETFVPEETPATDPEEPEKPEDTAAANPDDVSDNEDAQGTDGAADGTTAVTETPEPSDAPTEQEDLDEGSSTGPDAGEITDNDNSQESDNPVGETQEEDDSLPEQEEVE